MKSRAGSIRTHRIDTGRITLNVREIGDGPIALFLHGITSNSAVWDPIILDLQRDFRCIAVDQRGHGLSDKPLTGYNGEDYGKDIRSLIETLNSGPAIIVGHSLGARNGIVAAAAIPNLIRAVVAIDFTPFIESDVFDALELRVNGGDRLFKSQKEIESYLSGRYPLLPPDAIGRRASSAYQEVEGGFRPLASPKAMAATASGLRENLGPTFKSVKRPLLIVRGEFSKLVSVAALAKTQELRPDLPTLVVDKVDHYVNEEAPDVVIKAIRDFVSRN